LINLPPADTPEPLVQENIDDIRAAVEIFSHVEDLEGVLRGRLLAADFYELLGQQDRAQEIALEVLPQAEAMGYVRQIEHAKDHLSGRGLLSRIRSSKVSRTEEEKIIRNATLTDDEIREYAVQMLRILGLPSERFPVMEREYLSMRGIAREQLTWCRHIELLEDLRHTKHPSTEYRKDPDRVCICKLYQYKSVLEYPDWGTVIAAFKRTYCEGCGGRSPLESKES
jgi:hypothetical protein